MKATLTLPITVKNVEAAGSFEAIAWRYSDEPDRTGDVILPGAFDASLQRYSESGGMPAMLWQHDQNEPIGYWRELSDTERGLEVAGQFDLNNERGAEAYRLAKNKGLSLSIGFAMKADDVSVENDVRYIAAVDLLEVSLVSVPANPGAVIQQVKSLEDCQTEKEFEALVRDALGLSRRQAKRLTGLAYTAMTQRDAEAVSDDQDQQIIQALKSATNQIRGITP